MSIVIANADSTQPQPKFATVNVCYTRLSILTAVICSTYTAGTIPPLETTGLLFGGSSMAE